MPAIERLAWTAAAWDDYLHWQTQDRRLTHFAFGVKKQVKRQPMAGILAPKLSQHTNTIMASQPVIRHGDQKIHVGIWPGCSPSA
jgi:hypothetical protein